MNSRIKWILVGFGFIVGIQVLTTLMYLLLIQVATDSPGTVESDQWAMVIFGLTLGAFLFGGFMIGRIEEKPRVYDALTAAALALVFSAFIYQVLPEGTREQFTGGKWLTNAAGNPAPFWLSMLQMIPALVAAAIGAYMGYLMTTPVETALERFVGYTGLVSAFFGVGVAYVIGSMVLPWYWLAALLVLIVGGIACSYWTFHRGEHEMEELTIIAEHRPEAHS